MIDTHAHLDACADRPSALIRRARSAGVDRIVTVGTGIESSQVALELADLHEEVFAALGIDPHQAGDAEAGRVDELRELLQHEQAVAVGETGLDYFRDRAPRDRQRKLFEAQLELAAELGKPVVIHTRDAEADTADVLSGFDGTVVMHCFSVAGAPRHRARARLLRLLRGQRHVPEGERPAGRSRSGSRRADPGGD